MTFRTLRVAAVTVSALLLAAGLVRAASADYQQRQNDAYKAAMAKRKTLGLDGPGGAAKLAQDYPTPEVKFAQGARYGDAFAIACPGDTARVTIPGTFQTGTTFIVQSNVVKVLGEKLTAKGWDATIQIPKNLPHDVVPVQIAAPVSFKTVTVNVLEIRCALRFKLKLDNGTTLETTLSWKDDSSDFRGTGAWKPGGEANLRGQGTGPVFNLNQEAKQEELMAGMNKMQAAMESPAMQALDKRQQKVMAALNACTTKPPAQMESCMAGPTKEMDAISKERERLMAGGMAPARGCQSMNLELENGKVTGRATTCSDGKDHSVTGTFASP